MSEKADPETGEVIDDPTDDRSPYQIARSDLAAFKFKLVETVAADPRLSKAPCTDAVVVLMSFVTIDKRTLKPTPAYASTITLIARGGMKMTAAKMAMKLLKREKYLVPTGSKTKDGCVKYRLENPHQERVQIHVDEATRYWKERAAEERKKERRKKANDAIPVADVGSECDPTESERGVSRQPDVGSECDPNYLGTNLSGSSSEERGQPFKEGGVPSNGYAAAKCDDQHIPFPIPASEAEATAILEALAAGRALRPGVMQVFRRHIMAGTLTPAMVEQQRRFAA
ncbi:hypothetical protein [Mesorhizobium sp.]|uniref:hypothetical protein n=1 Tax=Mesorhizobium sp. TaxID=1871066 RepID=UPI000FE660BD|nr:hypothetical protein [Mesorhizobium sp.]RWH46824.1 MAG: hypothetical protein EOQ78_02135 [Mesorhizobium sp.]RWI25849.1 MAG: hypothetical protein EOQ94_09685 [Mesorhizobium sp.]